MGEGRVGSRKVGWTWKRNGEQVEGRMATLWMFDCLISVIYIHIYMFQCFLRL